MTELPAGAAKAISVGIEATDRGDFHGALKIFSEVYTTVSPDRMPDGLSSYGLCLARVEGKRKMAADLCQKAIQLQSYDGRHWANLVRVYIVAKNRKKAVETLDDSLRKLRNDPDLIRVRQEIGYRQAPMLTFLPRRNPINKLFGLYAARLARRSKIIVIVIASLLYVGIVGAIFKLIVK
jgi:tetratricopeptide (TPR) repeat protein